MIKIAADPYAWPWNGDLRPENTALVIIDMQNDLCSAGGAAEEMGFDIALTRAPITPIRTVLETMRSKGFHVIHTREGHRPDLSDLPATKRWRARQIIAGVDYLGSCGRILIRGQPEWEIIPELSPRAGEVVIDKPGTGSFYATDMELVLRTRSITNLILTGITTDVCVTTTLREANDRGFECMVLADCCGSTTRESHMAALNMMKMQGGIFGTVTSSDTLLQELA